MNTKLKLSVRNLKKYFQLSKNIFVHAVDGVNFDIFKGETLGLVGESGCGKTTLGRSILLLIRPNSGEIILKGENILNFNKRSLSKVRKEMQIIFQDPFSSLDPRKGVESIINEPLRVHRFGSRKQIRERVLFLLNKTGLDKNIMTRYPHELDGGRCQRVGIARALALDPSFIVCDEPVSALDVSAQAQILNLLENLRNENKLTFLFISHDLSVVRKISHKIMVMYLGLIVEIASADELFSFPLHPYTQALLSAIPTVNFKKRRERIILRGDVPTPINIKPGCRFYKRCIKAMPICEEREPVLKEIKPNHLVACNLYE